MISKKLLLLLASLILAMPGIALSATTAATSSVKTDSYEITTQNGHMIVSFTFDKPLLNSTMVTMAGKQNSDGSCTWTMPHLKLGPSEAAVESRQVRADMTACTAVYEVGTPSDVSGASGRTVSPSYVGLKEGYEKAYFEDPFHIDVNDVWTHISWVSGASCVGSPSGYGSFNWLSYDGWTKVYGNTYSQNNCGNYEIWSNAQFANPSFPGCSTYSTAYTTYSGVSAEGFNDGTLYGWVDGMTSSVVNGVCPPLSAHQQLVQTYP